MNYAPCPLCLVSCPAEVLVFEDRGQRVTQTITRCATHGRGVARDVAPSTTEPNSAAEPAPRLAAGYRGEHACEGCGARFQTTFPGQRFCSMECRYEARRKRLEAQRRARGAPIRQRREKGARATRICALEACGAEFTLLPGKPHQRFCSRPCADKGRHPQQQRVPRESRQCPTCGESFEVRASSPQRFCSRSCSLQRFCSRSCGRTQVKDEPEYEPQVAPLIAQVEDLQRKLLRESRRVDHLDEDGPWLEWKAHPPDSRLAVEVMARLDRPHRLAGWLAENVPARVLAASAELAARLEEPA